jgi:hypothetical protein
MIKAITFVLIALSATIFPANAQMNIVLTGSSDTLHVPAAPQTITLATFQATNNFENESYLNALSVVLKANSPGSTSPDQSWVMVNSIMLNVSYTVGNQPAVQTDVSFSYDQNSNAACYMDLYTGPIAPGETVTFTIKATIDQMLFDNGINNIFGKLSLGYYNPEYDANLDYNFDGRFIEFDEQAPTGVNEAALVSFNTYPNPVSDLLNIQSSQPVMVTLTDMNGKRTQSISVQGNGTIPVSHLAAGMYVATATDTNGKSTTKKIFVTH